MNRLAKFGIIVMVAALACQAVPAKAASNPKFDVTGVWKNSVGDTLQLFQEKDQVNGVFVNAGYALRMEGRYVSQSKVKLILIRRTRPNTCETTMTVDITVTSANALHLMLLATETACGLTSGQNIPDQVFIRVL